MMLFVFFLSPLYIHSVFMSADDKERGSIHAGGGVAANSWQLFKYLLSLSPPFLYISTLVSVETERRMGVGGLISLPPSISNSLCSPHASRGSDLTLPRRKADPLQCFITWWSGWLNALPRLLLLYKHTARLQKQREGSQSQDHFIMNCYKVAFALFRCQSLSSDPPDYITERS